MMGATESWCWPLGVRGVSIPRTPHPGAFGTCRKYDVHTGVDLYAPEGTPVFAVEDGEVVAVGTFTGPEVGSPWWHTTKFVMVHGVSGVVLYGEVQTTLKVGLRLIQGAHVGSVLTVLTKPPREDIPEHSASMLHLELYEAGVREPVEWPLGEGCPAGLLDPTPHLLKFHHEP